MPPLLVLNLRYTIVTRSIRPGLDARLRGAIHNRTPMRDQQQREFVPLLNKVDKLRRHHTWPAAILRPGSGQRIAVIDPPVQRDERLSVDPRFIDLFARDEWICFSQGEYLAQDFQALVKRELEVGERVSESSC